MPVLLALVEDDASFSGALLNYFALSDQIRCAAVFRSAEEALVSLPALAPEVLLVDINLPHMGGIDLVARIKQLCPGTLCLMLTMHEESAHIFEALAAGACGYLLKRISPRELTAAILQAHAGGSPMSPEIARRVVSYFHLSAPPQTPLPELATLSAREREVLDLLSQGYLYKEIGERLVISPHTVNTHIRRIYEKLHVRSRSQAVAKYRGLH